LKEKKVNFAEDDDAPLLSIYVAIMGAFLLRWHH